MPPATGSTKSCTRPTRPVTSNSEIMSWASPTSGWPVMVTSSTMLVRSPGASISGGWRNRRPDSTSSVRPTAGKEAGAHQIGGVVLAVHAAGLRQVGLPLGLDGVDPVMADADALPRRIGLGVVGVRGGGAGGGEVGFHSASSLNLCGGRIATLHSPLSHGVLYLPAIDGMAVDIVGELDCTATLASLHGPATELRLDDHVAPNVWTAAASRCRFHAPESD